MKTLCHAGEGRHPRQATKTMNDIFALASNNKVMRVWPAVDAGLRRHDAGILLACFFLIIFAASPAHAGTMGFTNGQGQWQPTQCPKPIAPQQLSNNSEAAAGTLNGQGAGFNAFVQASQRYMDCITQEAKVDAQSSANTVLNSLSREVQATQAEVDRQRALMFQRR